MEFEEESGFDDELLPEEEASHGVLAAAQQFFDAVARSDHHAVWEMFSDNARAYVLNVAVTRGMDFDLASRIRAGTATEDEREEYLLTLLEGIRRDLRGVDFGKLLFESKAEPEAPMQMRVTYLVQMQESIAGMVPAIPAGSLVVAYEDGEWKVERLVPRPG